MTDYSEVVVPDDTPPTEFSYVERRAEILKLMEQKGHPHGFNYSKLGRRYGVSHVQIRKDFAKLKEYYRDNIGTEAKATSELAYNRIVQGHLDNGDLEKARRALDSWNEWLFDIGAQERAPDKHELAGEGGGPLEITFSEEVVETPWEADDE